MIQHKKIVPNPHKHCYQSPGWVNCVNPKLAVGDNEGTESWDGGIDISKSLFVVGNVCLVFGKVYFVCLDTVALGTLAEC